MTSMADQQHDHDAPIYERCVVCGAPARADAYRIGSGHRVGDALLHAYRGRIVCDYHCWTRLVQMIKRSVNRS